MGYFIFKSEGFWGFGPLTSSLAEPPSTWLCSTTPPAFTRVSLPAKTKPTHSSVCFPSSSSSSYCSYLLSTQIFGQTTAPYLSLATGSPLPMSLAISILCLLLSQSSIQSSLTFSFFSPFFTLTPTNWRHSNKLVWLTPRSWPSGQCSTCYFYEA